MADPEGYYRRQNGTLVKAKLSRCKVCREEFATDRKTDVYCYWHKYLSQSKKV